MYRHGSGTGQRPQLAARDAAQLPRPVWHKGGFGLVVFTGNRCRIGIDGRDHRSARVGTRGENGLSQTRSAARVLGQHRNVGAAVGRWPGAASGSPGEGAQHFQPAELSPLPDEIEAPVLLKVGDNVSTDEISPAGARALPFRSDIPKLAMFSFTQIDDSYPQRAQQAQASGHIIVGGEGTLADKQTLQVDNVTKDSSFTVRHRLSPRQVQDVLAGELIPGLAED